jgi:hypothetical protein
MFYDSLYLNANNLDHNRDLRANANAARAAALNSHHANANNRRRSHRRPDNHHNQHNHHNHHNHHNRHVDNDDLRRLLPLSSPLVSLKCGVSLRAASLRFTVADNGSRVCVQFRVDALTACHVQLLLGVSEIETSAFGSKAAFAGPLLPVAPGFDSFVSIPMPDVALFDWHALVAPVAADAGVVAYDIDVDGNVVPFATPAPQVAAAAPPFGSPTRTPVVVLVSGASDDPTLHVHVQATYAVLLKCGDGSFELKAVEQRVLWRDCWYLTHELFGSAAIAPPVGKEDDETRSNATNNKDPDAASDDSSFEKAERAKDAAIKLTRLPTHKKQSDDDNDDNDNRSSESRESSASSSGSAEFACSVCLSAPRCIAVMPCRHLSLCSSCANELRHRSNRCPICRGVALALLQIDLSGKSPADAALPLTQNT